jgi:hypothetical protein
VAVVMNLKEQVELLQQQVAMLRQVLLDAPPRHAAGTGDRYLHWSNKKNYVLRQIDEARKEMTT